MQSSSGRTCDRCRVHEASAGRRGGQGLPSPAIGASRTRDPSREPTSVHVRQAWIGSGSVATGVSSRVGIGYREGLERSGSAGAGSGVAGSRSGTTSGNGTDTGSTSMIRFGRPMSTDGLLGSFSVPSVPPRDGGRPAAFDQRRTSLLIPSKSLKKIFPPGPTSYERVLPPLSKTTVWPAIAVR